MAVSEGELRRAVADIVGTGAVSREAIEAEVRARDLPTGHRLNRVFQDDATLAEVEAGYVHVPSLLEGTSWTVWVDADDAKDDFVRVTPYLSPMAWWLVVADDVPLVDGRGTRLGALTTEDLDDDDIVVGPDGWLAELAGRWATVRVMDAGLQWAACDAPPGATPPQIAAVRAGYQTAVRTLATDRIGPTPPADLPHATGDHTINEAFVVDRAAFVDAPIPPLPELFEAAGLEARGPIVAERGFNWDKYRGWQDRNRLAAVYGL